jgi:hypothetical protein
MTSTISATTTSASRHEDAILILQNTQDGDLLHPRDLKLVECVVNGMALSVEGAQYWRNLVESTCDGRYTSDWFCGIEGLTRNHLGYVYWKGHEVEHYDLIPGREEVTHAQARILAAICITLDNTRIAVKGSTVADFYRRMHCADGVRTPRYLVSWAMNPAGFEAVITPLEQVERKALEEEVSRKAEEAVQRLGVDAYAMRSSQVITQEDFEAVIETIRGDACWAQRALMGAYQRSDVADGVIRQITDAVDQRSLLTRVAVEAHFLEPVLSVVSAAADAELSKDEYRFERARG